MAYIESEALITGDSMIDILHCGLFSAMNRSMDAAFKGPGWTKMNERLEFLDNYILTHFNKETLMDQSDYLTF